MPRLGDDPNIATAYPDRRGVNLRGSCARQLATTAIGTLLLLFVMNKIILTDYKDATKEEMSKRGMGSKIDSVIPKTASEVQKERALAKQTISEKFSALQEQVKNLTEAVAELQGFETGHGATLQHPIARPPDPEGGGDGTGATESSKNPPSVEASPEMEVEAQPSREVMDADVDASDNADQVSEEEDERVVGAPSEESLPHVRGRRLRG